LASLFGPALAESTITAQLDSNGNLPVVLGGVSVQINGRNAGLIFISPSQINLWVPPETEVGTAQVVVSASGGQVLGTGTAVVQQTALTLFSLNATGQGPGAIENAVTYVLQPFFVQTPANPGTDKQTRLAIYGTGIRLAGAAANGNVAQFVAVSALLSDDSSVSLPVEYAGAAPGFFGLDQVNVVLPSELDGKGTVTVTLTINSQISNGVTIDIWSLNPPQIASFSPAAIPPGGILTISGTQFAAGPPTDRNQIILTAGNGLTVTVLPLTANSNTLTIFVPPLANSPQAAWYSGPLTLCVRTDTHQSCSPQILTVQPAATVPGTPGDLLYTFIASAHNAVLASIQTTVTAAQLADLQNLSTTVLQDLSKKIADALAGTPQTSTLTVNGQTVTAAFDLATIRNLESLLTEAKAQFNTILASPQQLTHKRTGRMAASDVLFPTEESLTNAATLYEQYDNYGKTTALLQYSGAGIALAACVLLQPGACLAFAGALAAAAPAFTAATVLQVGGMLAIDIGANRLQALSTDPANSVALLLWEPQNIEVNGTFVARFGPSDGAEAIATAILTPWLETGLTIPIPTAILDPIVNYLAQDMLDMGLSNNIQTDLSIPSVAQNVALSWNTVGSNCEQAWFSPSPTTPFILDPSWTFYPLQVTSFANHCIFLAQDNLLWLTAAAPSAFLTVTVTSNQPSTCGTFPFADGPVFDSIYYVSEPAPNGDRVVLGSGTDELWGSLAGVFLYPNFIPQLPLPAFTNELYCQPVEFTANGCTATAYVPTSAERSGDFSTFPIPLIDPTSGNQFPNNIIPASRLDPLFAWRVQSTQGCGQP
jgi:uncharacterized protein (TIGR03437 family)